ncbi:hypothetical protein J4231_03365, partial [Candidatus Woesearchaeota archaeon]|nr:hypothetical protein [Candidatus Woesearchaeota archaeon]
MVLRTFDEMKDDSARLYADNKGRLETRLRKLTELKENLTESEYKAREAEIREMLAIIGHHT